jgi:hypothetical protein
MNRLTKLARVISDQEAIQNGFSNRHEMYAYIDKQRTGNGPSGIREMAFATPVSGAATGAITGLAGLVGLGAIPGILGKLSERDIELELAARNTDPIQSDIESSKVGGAFKQGLKGAIGGLMFGPLGGAISGYQMGSSQQRLLDKIRNNRVENTL